MSNAAIKLPNGRTVEAHLAGFDCRAVQRYLSFTDGGRYWTYFDCVITWRHGDPPEQWSATIDVSSGDEAALRRGVGTYVQHETFETGWHVLSHPVTDPDEIVVAVVQTYVGLRPNGPPPPRHEEHLTRMTHHLDDLALGQALGRAWTAGLLYAIGYSGPLVHEGEIDRLALGIVNSVPGLAVEDDLPSPRFLAGLARALHEARGDGIIQLAGDLVQ